MGLTGLTPRPRPLAAPTHADPPLAPTATHHRAPAPTHHRAPAPTHRPARKATHHPAPTATPGRATGHPPRHTVVIMTSGAYAAAKS
jgi:hypothetical protein